MSGFIVSNIHSEDFKLKGLNIDESKLFTKTLNNDEFTIMRTSLDSFRDDKIMVENDKKIIITEGVICNTTDLFKKYDVDNLFDLIVVLSEKRKDFFAEFRGSFSGGVFDKEKKEWIFFTDQLGSHSIYYYKKENAFVVASQLNYITEFMKLNNIAVEEDLHGLHCILDWGYLIDTATAIKGIKRIYPGEYININDKGIKNETYYTANYPLITLPVEEHIERIDKAFSNAVYRIINKCVENGYKTVIDISGGLDSRLIAFRAVELFGKEDITAFHFSQYESIEQKVAFEVIQELNLEAFYYPMDTSDFLKSFKEIITLNNGSSYYLGLQAGLSFGKFVDSREYGIEITGALGDVRDSAMLLRDGDVKPSLEGRYYKSNSLNDLNGYSNYSTVIEKFETNDVFWTYLRGISAGMNTTLAKQTFIESMTPYGDIEFLEAYLSIPWKYRVDNKILLEWMKRRFPKAASIKYSQTNLPARDTWTWKHINYNRVRRRLKFLLPKKNMLDLEHWMNSKDVKCLTDQYYCDKIILIHNDEIKEKVDNLYNNGNALEKSIALSVLAIYDVYF